MPREIVLFGVYLPNLTLLFVITLAVGWGIDRLVAWSGLYRHAWHPTLLRASLFTCLYGVLMLYVYH